MVDTPARLYSDTVALARLSPLQIQDQEILKWAHSELLKPMFHFPHCDLSILCS